MQSELVATLRKRLSAGGYFWLQLISGGIALVDSFGNVAGGKGGYWEDNGYQWYAGI